MQAADGVFAAAVCLLLVYGAVWDARKRIIPDSVSIGLGILGLVALFASEYSVWCIPLLSRIAGCALPSAILLTLYALQKPVGGGDFKLSAALGFLLGLEQFAAAYCIGGVIALVWAGVKKQKSVPLAVFLAIGVVALLLSIFLKRG